VTFATETSGARTVLVAAAGTVMRPPDVAYVQANIMTEDVTAAGAIAQNESALDVLKTKLQTLGIAENKVRTTSFLQPIHAPAPPTESRYTSSRQIEIMVDKLANAGRAAALAAALPSADRVAIRYALDDHDAAYRTALSLALSDAEKSAREAAAAQHVRLGALVRIVPSPIDRVRTPSMVVPFHLVPVIGGFAQPRIPVPELEVRAAATVTYTILP
jgi:uncharacterized protein YggE